MTRFEYNASHEQFTPADQLRWTKYAEQAGFDCDFDEIRLHQVGRQLSFIEAFGEHVLPSLRANI